MHIDMSRRTTVTLPDTIFDALERWADLQGRPTANLASHLIEVAVTAAVEKGDIPSADTASGFSPRTIQGVINQSLQLTNKPWSNARDRVAAFCEAAELEIFEIDSILQGAKPNDGQMLAIARVTGMSVTDVDTLVRKQYGNGQQSKPQIKNGV